MRAELIESPASREFLSLLPLTLAMTAYSSREKYGPMPALSRDNMTGIKAGL
ncbi:cyclophilin-like fold protein [Brucepastera parasyntrophica]|uniref:cyclophilin-like fold protein n=1 Tax=Brucepastera parasyntrophica TaxID=2880008 RepID=UPI003F716E13